MNALRAQLAALRALQGDRKRAQRGSVLSAVLIIVACLAILSGAITTALSTNAVLSKDLLNRVNTEATVNSAAELGLNQLQGMPLNAPCPGPITTPTLNSLTATATVDSCEAVIHKGESTSFTSLASSNPFNIDGAHYAQGANGPSDYIVGDAGGNVFDYQDSSVAPSFRRWKLALGGSVTAPPAVIPNPNDTDELLDLIPLSGSPCAPATFCVSVLADDGSVNPPQARCTMASTAAIDSQPSARSGSRFAYVGDTAGNLYAMDLAAQEPCDIKDQTGVGGPIVAGPVAFPCQISCGGSNADDVLVVTSNAPSSHALTFSYAGNGFNPAGSLNTLPVGASGIALDGSTLPARLAITFSSGIVALVDVDTKANPALIASVSLSINIAGAPFWCHCPGSLDLIGVGGTTSGPKPGVLSVLSAVKVPTPGLNVYGTYLAGSAIRTTPAADAMGDWYVGADDGQLFEVAPTGGSMQQVAGYGPANGQIGSSPVVGTCQVGICAYLGSTTANLYELALDARSAVITACITTAPPNCSGLNPRVWTSVEIGVAGNPQTVHVEGWSYYSP